MTAKRSAQIILTILSLVTIFHLCILFKLIPYNIAWGGRLENDQAMYVFESISILINVLMIWFVLMKSKKTKPVFKPQLINAVLWIFFALFLLNTVGNIIAKTTFEKIFAFVTLFLAINFWVLLKSKK